MLIRAIIVDNQLHHRENLVSLISTYCKNVKVVGLANSVDTALKLIKSQKPDLVFLDIVMPGKNGFKLLESLEEIDFEIIIVTTHAQHAIQAIKFSVIDYLLKPIDIAELSNAIANASRNMEKKQENLHLRQLIRQIQNMDSPEKIGLASDSRVDFVEISRIIRCQADNNCTYVFFETGDKLLISKTLKEFEDILNDYGFIRIHKSHLINTSHIQSFQKGKEDFLKMTDNCIIPISRSKKAELCDFVNSYTSF
jgi:two-component system LytT family response regulator